MKNIRLVYFLTFLLAACGLIEALVFVHLSAVLNTDLLPSYVIFFPWFILVFEFGRTFRIRGAVQPDWILAVLNAETWLIPAALLSYFLFYFLSIRFFSSVFIHLFILVAVSGIAFVRGYELDLITRWEYVDPAPVPRRIFFYFYLGLFSGAWLFALFLLPLVGLTVSAFLSGAVNAAGILGLFGVRDQVPVSRQNQFYLYLYFHLILSALLGWGAIFAARGNFILLNFITG